MQGTPSTNIWGHKSPDFGLASERTAGMTDSPPAFEFRVVWFGLALFDSTPRIWVVTRTNWCVVRERPTQTNSDPTITKVSEVRFQASGAEFPHIFLISGFYVNHEVMARAEYVLPEFSSTEYFLFSVFPTK